MTRRIRLGYMRARDEQLGAVVRVNLPHHVRGDAYEPVHSIVREVAAWERFCHVGGWVPKMLEAIADELERQELEQAKADAAARVRR